MLTTVNAEINELRPLLIALLIAELAIRIEMSRLRICRFFTADRRVHPVSLGR